MAQMALAVAENAVRQPAAAVSARAPSSPQTGALGSSLGAIWPEIPEGSWETWSEGARPRGKALLEAQLQDLVNRARGGDHGAFETLVNTYQARIYNHVARIIHDPAEAEDVAQETFVRAYQALPRFRGESSFQTWLYRIASNLAIDASRRRTRRQWQTVSLDGPLEEEDCALTLDPADGGSRTPGEEVDSGALRHHVWSALAELSDKLRPLVVLYDLQGFSYGEIAQLLDCPLGTVKSRLFSARCQLRDKLRQRLPEDFLADLTASTQSPVFGAAV